MGDDSKIAFQGLAPVYGDEIYKDLRMSTTQTVEKQCFYWWKVPFSNVNSVSAMEIDQISLAL